MLPTSSHRASLLKQRHVLGSSTDSGIAMLTEALIRTAKPSEKPQKLVDEHGLYLLVTPSGGRLWRQRYWFGGKEKQLGLGQWPAVSLKTARDRRDENRRLVAQGLDPSAKRRLAASAGSAVAQSRTFETAAREWWAARNASERWDE